MPRIASWIPDRLNIATDEVKELVALQFGHGDDDVEIVFPRQAIVPLFEQIMKAGRFEPPTPIEPDHLASAITYEAHEVWRADDGEVLLNVKMRTDDGVRSLAIKMPPDEAVTLANLLTRYASGQPDSL